MNQTLTNKTNIETHFQWGIFVFESTLWNSLKARSLASLCVAFLDLLHLGLAKEDIALFRPQKERWSGNGATDGGRDFAPPIKGP